ncbi:carboxymuconolactone decarboxylase family protein [Sphingobium sp.]|uniref:carboxymuconolactone decarboxylase family protein n=1 Tax=Sphingobium sp. TaxID=1912891 RepID=UPI0028BEE0A4|nr:carboxymuconolactone decarboxylase family protein [Sphingobium sp.]
MSTESEQDSRYERGLRIAREIHGDSVERVRETFESIAPDFARTVIEFPFGDIGSRPGLDQRSREIAIIGALAAMATAAPELAVHIRAGLRVGLTREEIVEILIQTTVYAGFPAAIGALKVAKAVFAEVDG